MEQYFVNGFCLAHNKHWLDCDECREADQKQSAKAWFEKQRLNTESYRHFHEITEQNYRAICGDPVQGESFR